MRLSPPKVGTWWLAFLLAALGVLAHLGYVGFLAPYAFWILVLGFAVLALGNLFKGI